MRPEYILKLDINGRQLNRVIIDQHYKKKHARSINDQLILELVKELNEGVFTIEEQHGEFQYFTVDLVWKNNKAYRLILLLCIAEKYLGVINAFRINRRKYHG